MKITYFRGKYPNFGDELNTWMWQKLLPDFFDEDDSDLFIGIGSTIGDHYDKSAKKIVFGAGFVPSYNEKPEVNSPDWDVYFVRGPRTAKALNISPDLSLGDAAILLRTVTDYKNRKPEVISFIPHWESLERGNWQEVCRIAGINLIDPRRPVEEVINELLRSKLVICEAMHGAIISDAFRIPWIPIIPLVGANRDKWYDWADALNIKLTPQSLIPSSVQEARTIKDLNTASNRHMPDFISATRKTKSSLLNKIRSVIKSGLNMIILYTCACRMKIIARTTPHLSRDDVIEDITSRMLEKLELLRRNYSK